MVPKRRRVVTLPTAPKLSERSVDLVQTTTDATIHLHVDRRSAGALHHRAKFELTNAHAGCSLAGRTGNRNRELVFQGHIDFRGERSLP